MYMTTCITCITCIMYLYILLQLWVFCKPVSSKTVPDYYNLIKFPMDLQTMKEVCNNNNNTICSHDSPLHPPHSPSVPLSLPPSVPLSLHLSPLSSPLSRLLVSINTKQGNSFGNTLIL